MVKSEIRKLILLRRLGLTNQAYKNYSTIIQEHLLSSELFITSSVIGIYMPIKNEVDTNSIIQNALSLNKTIVIPRIDDAKITFTRYKDNMSLTKNQYGIPEVSNGKDFKGNIDLLVCPAIAMDNAGNRVGYGKGFYDKALVTMQKCTAIALIFDCQRVDKIDIEDHDIGLPYSCSEEGILKH
jgi:5-formyltetrahydrofolate cyclo-ligase